MDMSVVLLGSIAAEAPSDSSVPAAWIGAGSAIIVALLSVYYAARTGRRQALLEKRLAQEGKAEDARRDYEYDARKRLYRECEPVLFQARELATEARRRITGLAFAARDGYIREDGIGWLDHAGYYSLSMCYNLVAPAVAYQVLQRRLTDFDLELEPRIHVQYEVLKLLYASFSDDFDLARVVGLEYRPDDADQGKRNWKTLRADKPAIYQRQGLYRGTISLVGNAFLTSEAGAWRCKTFSEFYVEAQQKRSPIRRVLPELLDLVRGFHPARCPVLWLVLIEQLMLYDVLLQYDRVEVGDQVPVLEPSKTESYVEMLRWEKRQQQGEAEQAAQYQETLTSVRDFVTAKIRKMRPFTSPRRN
jgi:hypothetical protein